MVDAAAMLGAAGVTTRLRLSKIHDVKLPLQSPRQFLEFLD
jgi:hypothetical protein